MKRAARAVRDFFKELLIGDTPELFVAGLVLVGAALLLRHERVAAMVLLPVGTLFAVGASAARARR